MNLIKKELIEEVSLKHANFVVQKHTPTEWDNEQLKSLIVHNFKGSVQWAESQLEELAIEFAEWIKENNEESIDNRPTWEAWLTYNISTDTLFQQFIKKRNE